MFARYGIERRAEAMLMEESAARDERARRGGSQATVDTGERPVRFDAVPDLVGSLDGATLAALLGLMIVVVVKRFF